MIVWACSKPRDASIQNYILLKRSLYKHFFSQVMRRDESESFWIEEAALRAELAKIQEQGMKSDGRPLVG
jgi:hypothetical protein